MLGKATPTGAVTHVLDRGMLTRLAELVAHATRALDQYDYTAALRDTETFFWWFCDDHIEHVKRRRAGDGPDAESATASCLTALSVTLRLLAPVVPFVTEEVWSWWQPGSIHQTAWPSTDEVLHTIGGSPDAAALAALLQASDITAAIRRERSLKRLAFGVPVASLQVPERARAEWQRIGPDVLAGNNAAAAAITFGDDFAIEFAAPAR